MVRIKLLLIFIILPIFATAQVNRYMVFFTDKDNTPYSIDQPEQFLSQKAISRRMKTNVEITEVDLPVDPSYVSDLKANGIDVFYTTKWLNAVLIQTDEANLDLINSLSYVSSVEYVAKNQRLKSNNRNGKISRTLDHTIAINANQNKSLGINTLQHEGFFGQGVSIAFFDSGFKRINHIEAFNHLFTDDRIDYIYNFVDNSLDVFNSEDHGTKVVSIVAGVITNEFQGIAPEANYLFCVTEDPQSEYRVEEYNWLFAAEKADSAGVDIINSSLGYSFYFSDPTMDYSFAELNGETTVVTRAANLASQRGILVVTSVGNDADPINTEGPWEEISAPADAFNIISVGSTTYDGSISSFSSRGSTADGRIKPELVALGQNAVLINGLGNILNQAGTSFSAPQVAGLAVLLWQKYPDLTNLELRDLMLDMGDNSSSPNNIFGYGTPNYNITLSHNNYNEKTSFHIQSNPIKNGKLVVKFDSKAMDQEFSIYDAMGKRISSQKILSESHLIDVENWPRGLYLLLIEGGQKSVEKFIIK